MTNAELIQKIRAEIERLENYYTSVEWYVEELLSFLDTLESEKPMQEGLEKAVVDYFEGYWPGMETAEQCNTDLHFTPPAIMRLARHFAQWGAEHAMEQMMKEAVEGEICHDRAGVDYLDYDIARLDKYIFSRFKVGDKVRIIVLPKED